MKLALFLAFAPGCVIGPTLEPITDGLPPCIVAEVVTIHTGELGPRAPRFHCRFGDEVPPWAWPDAPPAMVEARP